LSKEKGIDAPAHSANVFSYGGNSLTATAKNSAYT